MNPLRRTSSFFFLSFACDLATRSISCSMAYEQNNQLSSVIQEIEYKVVTCGKWQTQYLCYCDWYNFRQMHAEGAPAWTPCASLPKPFRGLHLNPKATDYEKMVCVNNQNTSFSCILVSNSASVVCFLMSDFSTTSHRSLCLRSSTIFKSKVE